MPADLVHNELAKSDEDLVTLTMILDVSTSALPIIYLALVLDVFIWNSSVTISPSYRSITGVT